MEEEETFLVIVGDSDDEAQFEPTVTVKQELCDVPEYETLIDIVQTADIRDFSTDVKLEPDSEECENYQEYEFLEDEDIQLEYHQSPGILEYHPTDEEYIPEGYIPWPSRSLIPRNPKKMLPPEEQHSFVQDLRNTYPELAEDRDLLIQTLCEIMRNVKAPPTPDGSYVKHYDNINAFECAHCGYFSETRPAADRHYNEKHGPRYLVCYACGVDFRSTTNLYKHEKRCNAADARLVVRARARRLGSKGRGRPLADKRLGRRANTKVRYSCTQCSASFVTQVALEAHVNMHNGVKPYRCYACPAAYTSSSVLSRHEKKHKSPQFICDLCARTFRAKAALVAHMDTHRPIRKYGCEQCERRFAQKCALQLHVNRVHNNLPPPFACNVCEKRHARMSLLKQHMQREHGLLIMTRKMFFRKFPNMSEEEMKKVVKVIMKSDVENNDNNIYIEHKYIEHKTEITDDDTERGEMIAEKETNREEGNRKRKRELKESEEDIKLEETYAEGDDMIEILPESCSMSEFIKYLKLEGKTSDTLLVLENAEVLQTRGTREQIQRMLLGDVDTMVKNSMSDDEEVTYTMVKNSMSDDEEVIC